MASWILSLSATKGIMRFFVIVGKNSPKQSIRIIHPHQSNSTIHKM